MKKALYLDYSSSAQALGEFKSHEIKRVMAWVGHDPFRRTPLSEHELYAAIADEDLIVVGAFCPSDNLPYLSNTRYGKKDAIKHYKQMILSCAEHRVPLLVLDVAPTSAPFVESLAELAAYSHENGIMLCIRESEGADTVGLLTAVPNLFYCLDTARCLALGLDPVERITAAAERLAIVLVGDVRHTDDALSERLLPGTVHDFTPFWRALETSGYLGEVVVTAQSQGDGEAFFEAINNM